MNWIPSRYQEDPRSGEGDRKSYNHFVPTERIIERFLDITITLSFPRVTKQEASSNSPIRQITRINTAMSLRSAQSTQPVEDVIDTQRPLPILRSGSSSTFLANSYHIRLQTKMRAMCLSWITSLCTWIVPRIVVPSFPTNPLQSDKRLLQQAFTLASI